MIINKDITPDTDLKVGDVILDSLGQERAVKGNGEDGVIISDVLDKVHNSELTFYITYTEMARQGYKYKTEETSEEATEREEKELLAKCEPMDMSGACGTNDR